jgi:hypothetical protein
VERFAERTAIETECFCTTLPLRFPHLGLEISKGKLSGRDVAPEPFFDQHQVSLSTPLIRRESLLIVRTGPCSESGWHADCHMRLDLMDRRMWSSLYYLP